MGARGGRARHPRRLVERLERDRGDPRRDRVGHRVAREQRVECEVPVADLDVQVGRPRPAVARPRHALPAAVAEPADRGPEVLLVSDGRVLHRVHPCGQPGLERVEVPEHHQTTVLGPYIERSPVPHPRRAHALHPTVGGRGHPRPVAARGGQVEPGVEPAVARIAQSTPQGAVRPGERPVQRAAQRGRHDRLGEGDPGHREGDDHRASRNGIAHAALQSAIAEEAAEPCAECPTALNACQYTRHALPLLRRSSWHRRCRHFLPVHFGIHGFLAWRPVRMDPPLNSGGMPPCSVVI
ncbi:MAG: hypothetical protein RL721_1608 [Candidatus Eisenbacteria bacterium]